MQVQSSRDPKGDSVSHFVSMRMQRKDTTSGVEMIFQRAAIKCKIQLPAVRTDQSISPTRSTVVTAEPGLGLGFGVCVTAPQWDAVRRHQNLNWLLELGPFGDRSCVGSTAARPVFPFVVDTCCESRQGLLFSIRSQRGHAGSHQQSGHCTVQALAKQLAVRAVGPIRLIRPVWDLPAGCIVGNQRSCSLICCELSYCGEFKLCWSECIIKYVNPQCKAYTFISFFPIWQAQIDSLRGCVGSITWMLVEEAVMSVIGRSKV